MNHTSFTYIARSEDDTERLGELLASVIAGGMTIALNGPLGAGKTRLVQATSTALAVDRALVVSPTFVLVHEYNGKFPVIHIDTYRLRDEDEFAELGVSEYFLPPHVVFVEWADRMARMLPESRLDITIQVLAANTREFTVQGHGPAPAAAVEKLRVLLTI